MDLSLTETQEEFKKVAQDFVKAEVPPHQMTQWYKSKQTFQPRLFKKAAEIGWLGMMLPEQYGGSGVSAMDCAVVFEALGHGPLPGPLFTSGVLSGGVVLGMPNICVMPPARAAAVPVWKSSLCSPPGTRRWVCTSMRPGS